MSLDTDLRPSEQHIRRSRELYGILMPALREVARRHGYALAVHGSLERDIDLVAIPWRESAVEGATMVEALYGACRAIIGACTWNEGWTAQTGGREPPVGTPPNPTRKPHGRLGYVIHLGGGPYLDISVMPCVVAPTAGEGGAP